MINTGQLLEPLQLGGQSTNYDTNPFSIMNNIFSTTGDANSSVSNFWTGAQNAMGNSYANFYNTPLSNEIMGPSFDEGGADGIMGPTREEGGILFGGGANNGVGEGQGPGFFEEGGFGGKINAGIGMANTIANVGMKLVGMYTMIQNLKMAKETHKENIQSLRTSNAVLTAEKNRRDAQIKAARDSGNLSAAYTDDVLAGG